jgi:hypothetical protein
VIEASVAQLLGERAEAELRRVRAARPHLGSRCEWAEASWCLTWPAAARAA